jgi:hypothetical protein
MNSKLAIYENVPGNCQFSNPRRVEVLPDFYQAHKGLSQVWVQKRAQNRSLAAMSFPSPSCRAYKGEKEASLPTYLSFSEF